MEGQRLVRRGPYKYIRNPIYTGIVYGFLGTFITFGSLASLLGYKSKNTNVRGTVLFRDEFSFTLKIIDGQGQSCPSIIFLYLY
ncbi:methyltransferase family protein [Desulfitobacterium sp. AusDCA]|uniref:methyltransferase family protein n=1 Tax=Desulfitobacterium sp. AusDCA TaxID=3240383 RepID=UPI003DA734B6